MEFHASKDKKPNTLSCLAGYLWEKNEKEIIKKAILAEAYREVMAK